MILSGNEIKNQIEAGRINITPADNIVINPASVDLTLGREVAVYSACTYTSVADDWDPEDPSFIGQGLRPSPNQHVIDVKKPASIRKWKMAPETGWILQPGVGYLMHTAERVHTNHFVPVLDGKSSIGRLFVKVHETAGFGDPGFDGQFTLEVTALFPIKVYPGMRFCQVRFHGIEGEVTSYQELGRYRKKAAQGAIGSRIHETFEDLAREYRLLLSIYILFWGAVATSKR